MNTRRRCKLALTPPILCMQPAMMIRSTVLASTKFGRGETRPGSRVVVGRRRLGRQCKEAAKLVGSSEPSRRHRRRLRLVRC